MTYTHNAASGGFRHDIPLDRPSGKVIAFRPTLRDDPQVVDPVTEPTPAKKLPKPSKIPSKPPAVRSPGPRKRHGARREDHAGASSVVTFDGETGIPQFRVLTGQDKGRLTQALTRAIDLDLQEFAVMTVIVDWMNYGAPKNERTKQVGPHVVWLTQDTLASHARMACSTLQLVLARLEAKALIVIRAYDTTGLRRKDRRRDEYVVQVDHVLALRERPRKWCEGGDVDYPGDG